MSINSAMAAGVSGLIANSSALAAISDNIANVNTTAYKRNAVDFANVVTSQAVKGRYSAGGVQAVTRTYVAQQGLIQTASSPTDLGISGDGFFVVTDKSSGLTASDPRKFTRSGSFSVDADGFLVNDAKLYLQGWPVANDGTVDTSPSDLSKMSAINVKNLGSAVRATSNVVINANVDQRGITGSVGDTGYVATAASTSMAGYADNPQGNTVYKPDFTIEMNVIDSVGDTHKLAMSFLKDSTAPNTWHAEVYAVPASDVVANGNSGQLASGSVVFNSDGTFDKTNTTLFGGAGNTPSLTIDSSTGGVAPAWAASKGLASSTIALDLSKLSQYASVSSVKSVNPDGAQVGNVVGVEVDESGVVSAIFDNSEIRKIAQIGLATFPNPDGLKPVSGNAYQPTIPSGDFSVKQPKVAGAGQIASSTLEASTVDLSAEFTGLISTQKAYSASSKIITTADQMLEELISIKR
ncbi:flagellar hook protein FlgE [Phenylobacterium aquaticum]|uniref:flagellar hook protein FlgE n=1 Tax=Phenylobacterium aquaticum TaxID=1763816 RepID=UPI0026ECBE32|nr:flagellar hook protein FlgE [Phenylobacterium aquaticum]